MKNVKEPRNRGERRRCPFTAPYPNEEDSRGNRAECAVCHKPLDERSHDRDQFCDSHGSADMHVAEPPVEPPRRFE